jgi:hypothetical protein
LMKWQIGNMTKHFSPCAVFDRDDNVHALIFFQHDS